MGFFSELLKIFADKDAKLKFIEKNLDEVEKKAPGEYDNQVNFIRERIKEEKK